MKKIPARVLIQPDGKILVSGNIDDNGDENILMVRYNSDGTLDNTFANGGILTQNLAMLADDVFRGIVLVGNKIMVAARIESPVSTDYELALIRLNANGTFDNTFGVKLRSLSFITKY